MDLRLAGYTVRRYTGEQLDDHPDSIAVELREILSGAQ
jgi:hypothetical protein